LFNFQDPEKMIPDFMRVLHNHSVTADDSDYFDDSAGGELIFSDSLTTNKNPNVVKSVDYHSDYPDYDGNWSGNLSSLGSKGLFQLNHEQQ